ncbi:TPA: hypothetical protein ACOEXB_004377 [Yersinia enterocolitica]|uniref:hypothetical protein n=1 Tax=Yersinia enterocolitica TaxID=630 RepID=UPI0037082609
MARPKLKAEERYDTLLSQIYNSEMLDPWTFRDIVDECNQANSIMSQIVIALAYIAKGDVQDGLKQLELLLPSGDAALARLYCNMLERFSKFEMLDNCIYTLADKYPGKWLNYRAGGIAYLLGRLSLCSDYLERHCNMLTLDEGREVAEKFRLEAIEDMANAYETSHCTAEQYREIGFAVGRVLAEFPSSKFRADITGAHGGSYIIEVMNADPEQVSLMNIRLADEVCSVDLLDDCNLIARFSVERENSKGVNYAYI